MTLARLSSVVVLALASFANAAPSLLARQAFTTLSTAEVAAYKPYSYYAAAGYCAPAATLAWTCGINCAANPTFHPVASGGDGNAVQYWYVGVDTALDTVIVGHQGTDSKQILSIFTDINFGQKTLNRTLFPGFDSSIKVHSGFANEQAMTATLVLAAVKSAIATYGVKKVTMVGHSLGAALSLLDSVYLPLHLTGVTFRTVLYGLPRVGNQAFADLVSAAGTLTHVNNKKDPIPTLPGLILGFHHPTGEVHIQDDTEAWVACPGQDNNNALCTFGKVGNILGGDFNDHNGPYDGVMMNCHD
ncbi:lipase [Mycena belliarum]|uniref:Lipase n=1 Tax=Mycena belliarum TaxID=1033014 RepID=A0AAD6U5S0_9AGAR|nr:lipase [Mycena belliae]